MSTDTPAAAGPLAGGQELLPDQVAASYQRSINRGQGRMAKLLGLPVEVAASGCHVFDQEGRCYLDCGGYGVFTIGHRHPNVVAAVHDQLDRQPLSTRLFLNPVQAAAADALISVTPAELERVTFVNSGAEAVELALKLGRSLGLRRVVAMEGGFHGKTLGALSATGRDRYRAPFEPLLPGVEHVPFGDPGALGAALRRPGGALVILEPVQAEGGVRIPPPGFLAAVRDLCTRHGALLVVDEIQTGLGRLGAWWGCGQDGIVPDVLLAGKALGGGVMPVAAVLSTLAAYRQLDAEPLLHSSTFAGGQLAMAAVVATLDVMHREDVPARAARLGRTLLAGLRAALGDAGELIADVRGRGLMIGIEFRAEHHGARFLENMLDERVIVCYSLNSDRVARLTPSCALTEDDCAWLIKATISAVRRLSRTSAFH